MIEKFTYQGSPVSDIVCSMKPNGQEKSHLGSKPQEAAQSGQFSPPSYRKSAAYLAWNKWVGWKKLLFDSTYTDF